MLGMCASGHGSQEDARQYHLRAAELAREIGQPLLRLRTLQNLATGVYATSGQFSLALAAAEEARQIAHQYGLLEWLYFPLVVLALNLQITGQAGRCRSVLEELWQVSSPQAAGRAYYDFISALLEMDEGVLEAVPERLGRARTVAERTATHR
jgi:hypothetical protein